MRLVSVGLMEFRCIATYKGFKFLLNTEYLLNVDTARESRQLLVLLRASELTLRITKERWERLHYEERKYQLCD